MIALKHETAVNDTCASVNDAQRGVNIPKNKTASNVQRKDKTNKKEGANP